MRDACLKLVASSNSPGCLQKLGIPTEIVTGHQPWYNNPIEDMADAHGLGSSIHIMPGVEAHLYRAAPCHCWLTRARCAVLFGCSRLVAKVRLRRHKGRLRRQLEASLLYALTLHLSLRGCHPHAGIGVYSRLSGTLGAPLRTGFYVQQSVVRRLYASTLRYAGHKPSPALACRISGDDCDHFFAAQP